MIDLTPAGATIYLNFAGLTLAGLPSFLAICLNGLPVYHPPVYHPPVYQVPSGLRLRPGHTVGYIPDISPQFNLDLSMLN